MTTKFRYLLRNKEINFRRDERVGHVSTINGYYLVKSIFLNPDVAERLSEDISLVESGGDVLRSRLSHPSSATGSSRRRRPIRRDLTQQPSFTDQDDLIPPVGLLAKQRSFVVAGEEAGGAGAGGAGEGGADAILLLRANKGAFAKWDDDGAKCV